MGGSDFLKAGPSGVNEKFSYGTTRKEIDDDMDFAVSDSDDDDDVGSTFQELGEGLLKTFCKKASTAFFDQYGLISHQINSYNDFVKYGLQQLFDSTGEIVISPWYEPSKRRDDGWRQASLKFGKVTLDKPIFWTGDKFSADGGKEYLNLLPRHARLQNITYSSKIRGAVCLEAWIFKMRA